MKSNNITTTEGHTLDIQHSGDDDILRILMSNRHLDDALAQDFFAPSIDQLHDPYLLPDMEAAVDRILEARDKHERVVIFGDYDVDGVSGTAILVRFFHEIGIEVSYRLPHRVHDGYGLKSYFFDDLAEKSVKLVITVDCGTRDIEPIRHAKSLGIDVIVTDHHAVPEIIPEEVIALINPKRKDSQYPFSGLAGAGVAFTLVRGILGKIQNSKLQIQNLEPYLESGIYNLESIVMGYTDFAALGTVADCMPLIGENRTITTLGLRQMRNSTSPGIRKFVENIDHLEGNADVIGFQIGPRINASGRMDTPLTALKWLLASEDRCDDFLEEIEELNEERKKIVTTFSEKALGEADPEDGVLFFTDTHIEHGLIGLIAGKLTEAYNRPSIVLCPGHPSRVEVKKREYEEEVADSIGTPPNPLSQWGSIRYPTDNQEPTLVASCRAPEWCNLVELLDECKEFFVRYGGHRQAAGFTIEASRFAEFERTIQEKFAQKYSLKDLPKKTIRVESRLDPRQATLETLETIRRFEPFGIGNPRPLWLLEDVTITECKYLGKDQKHLSLSIAENPSLRLLYWNASDKKSSLEVGNIVSLVVGLDENEWNGKKSAQAIVQYTLI